MKAKRHYEKYWTGKVEESFFGYERNLVLPDLFTKGQLVLDLGCGDGVVSAYLQKELGVKVVGADISSKALKVAKKRGIKTVLIDAEKALPFKTGQFDVVFWGDNVEHLFEPEETLREIKRVLKCEGKLLISCPNMGYVRYRIFYLLKGRLSDTEWTGNPPWGWSHIRFFNLDILKKFIRAGGFRYISVIGVNKRFPERFLVKYFPSFMSMILIVEAQKNV